MKRIIIPLMLGFSAMLALVIGARLTQDSMAVVMVMAVCVVASVPVSILLIWLAQRAQRPSSEPELHCLPTEYVNIVSEPEPQPLQLPVRRQP